MGLTVDVHTITAVLLTDGKWHSVKAGSFDVGTYEFQQGSRLILGGGGAAGISEIGATWCAAPRGERVACPLSAIVAVKYLDEAVTAGQGAAAVRLVNKRKGGSGRDASHTPYLPESA